jgi:outer membrane immunogenic protein
MRRAWLVGFGLLAFSVSANPVAAAELAVAPVHKKAAAAPVFSWTGSYVGVHAGYGWGWTRQYDAGDPSPKWDINGWIAGGTIGYNWQFGNAWVAGLEADASWSEIEGSHGSFPGWGCASACVTNVEWFGTVRGRIGPTVDRLFAYATGGLAFGEVKSGILPCGATFCGSETRVGWTAGAGIEYAIAPKWSAKIEYLYVDLGKFSYGGPVDFAARAPFSLVRAGVNFRM